MFVTYKPEDSEANSSVEVLFEDAQGKLWCGTDDGRYWFEERDGKGVFHHLDLPKRNRRCRRAALARRCLLVREPISFEQGNRRIGVEPADSYQIDCLVDFTHPLIGVQHLKVELTNGNYSREIASARTFGFTEEIEALRRANLIRGGSLDNAIVLTEDGMLNETSLRFSDEFVRHKILDIVGDLALLGMPILGRVKAERSGHILHAGLMAKLLRVRSAWDIVDMPSSASSLST